MLRNRLLASRSRTRRRGRVRVRRGDRAHRVGRGAARHAAAAAAVPDHVGAVGQAHVHQQRRDARQRRLDHEHGAEAYSSFGSGTSRRARRSSRSPGKVKPQRPRRGRLRADARRADQRTSAEAARADATTKAVQIGGPSGGCHAGEPCSTRPSSTTRSRRSGRSSARAAWSSSTTPPAWSTSPATSWRSRRRSRAASACRAASAPSACSRSSRASPRATARTATSRCSSSSATSSRSTSLCALGETAPNPVLTTHPLLPRGVRGAHLRQEVPRECLLGALDLRGGRRQVQGLRRLQEELPRRRDHRRAQGALHHRSRRSA